MKEACINITTPNITESLITSQDNDTKLAQKKKLMRRRSCCCNWCGGISNFEKKHKDIVNDLEAFGRRVFIDLDLKNFLEDMSEKKSNHSPIMSSILLQYLGLIPLKLIEVQKVRKKLQFIRNQILIKQVIIYILEIDSYTLLSNELDPWKERKPKRFKPKWDK